MTGLADWFNVARVSNLLSTEITMVTGVKHSTRALLLLCCTAALHALPSGGAAAQQFLGNERQRCTGSVTVTTPGETLKVNPFEARSVDLNNSAANWTCQDQAPAETRCPENTNKILIDRSQGGSVFSIICLHD